MISENEKLIDNIPRAEDNLPEDGEMGSVMKRKSQLSMIWRQFRKNRLALAGLAVFLLMVGAAVFAPMIVSYKDDVIAQRMKERLQPPSEAHWFGTDQYGRDMFARVVWGSRISLSVGIYVLAASLLAGGAIGAAAGFYGGRVDNFLMRIMDVFLAVPSTILAVAVVGALGPGIVNILIAMSVSKTPQFARVVRSSVISISGHEFVEAARACGVRTGRLILRHVMPNAIGPVIVQATLQMANTILGVSGLSFIGLGIESPMPEWGSMLAEAREQMIYHPYLMVFPGLAIVLAVLSLNLIGDGLRDALDPRMKT